MTWPGSVIRAGPAPRWSRRLRFLPLSKDLRQAFQYCNLGYLVAGHLVEVISGTRWEDYLRTRLLTPLRMDRSQLSADDMLADPDHATGYERREGVVVPVPLRPVTAMAPAGAVNSCAADMARWLLAQLSGGQVDGQVVMSPGMVARQHAPHMVLPEDRTFPASTRHAYGLGWLVGQYRGHRLAEHGGGIDGFQTECMLLPDDGIGVAVMTNTSSSVMAPVVAYRVLDELLGLEPFDWFAEFKARYDALLAGIREVRGARRVVPGAALPRPLDAYAGQYDHPGYGTLTITVDGDTLRPHLGTMDMSLAHRHYETFDLEWHELGDQSHLFPLMFLSDPDGDITALTVPFEPSVGPLRFDRLPDAPARDPEVLRRLCGTYTMGPIEVVVAQKGGHDADRHHTGRPALRIAGHTGPALRGEGPARHHRRIRAGPGRRGRPPRGTATGDIPSQDITGRRRTRPGRVSVTPGGGGDTPAASSISGSRTSTLCMRSGAREAPSSSRHRNSTRPRSAATCVLDQTGERFAVNALAENASRNARGAGAGRPRIDLSQAPVESSGV